MRAYVPLLVQELRAVSSDARLPERQAFAVTPGLRRLDPTADEEDLEFEAMCQALDAARDLGAGRRVIASVDVVEVGGSAQDASLDVPLSAALDQVVSFHLEETEAPQGAGYDDLLWYDVTELPALTDLDA